MKTSNLLEASLNKIFKPRKSRRKWNKQHPNWHEDFEKYDLCFHYKYWIMLHTTGKRKPLREVNITPLYLHKLFIDQFGLCVLSGEILTCHLPYGSNQNTASIDRKDSTKGYIIGNVQWVHKDFNYMKQSNSDEYFIRMCKQVYYYNRGKGIID